MGFEQYITQMGTSVVDALIKPLLEHFHYLTSIPSGMTATIFVIVSLRASSFLGWFWNTLD